MPMLFRDLRYTLRNLARTPGFSIIVIVVMALGIGATAGLFTVVNSVLLKPLPLPDTNRLVMAYEADTLIKTGGYVAGGTFQYWRDQNRTFQQIAVSREDDYNLSSIGGQLPERIHAQICTWQALPLLGVKPAYGRLFTADDDKFGAPETTVLSWGFWKRRFGGDPGVLGRTVLLDAKPFTVIGILPQLVHVSRPARAALDASLSASHTGDHEFARLAQLPRDRQAAGGGLNGGGAGRPGQHLVPAP